MQIPFADCPEPTLGVELELHLTDIASGELRSCAIELLDDLAGDGDAHPKVKHELFQSTVEIITGICRSPAEARADLSSTLAEVQAALRPHGIRPLSAGTHPFGCAEDQLVSPDPRYHALVEEMQWTARRLLICGTHFHVGVPSGEHAIAVTNELQRHLPLFLILAASSPFFQGEDTGLASARSKVFESLPTAGLPPVLQDWSEFEAFMDTLLSSGCIQSVRDVWWDVRPHPDFGTVELRMCDAMPTLREVGALAALAQCLVAQLVERHDGGDLRPPPREWTVRENRWLAARHGVHADLIATDAGQRMPAQLLLEELVESLRPTADRLGAGAELGDVLAVWSEGPSYLRQRQILEDGGSTADVARALADELEAEQAGVVVAEPA